MGNLREIVDYKKPLKGMTTDVSPLNQIPNSYRLALNMMLESREGDYSALTNEEGNEVCFPLETGEKIVGTILINNGDTVIFIAHETQDYSKISILDKNCNLTLSIKASCLNFDKGHPIHGTFRISNGCDRVIYFTDDFNSVKSINLDNLGQYTPKIGVTPTDWVTEANTNDSWVCALFKHSPDLQVPNMTLLSEKQGAGELRIGAYVFAIRYLDDSFNPTNWIYLSNHVNVGDTITNNATDHLTNYDGGSLADLDDKTIATALEFEFSNLDTNFTYYQLAVIEYSEGFASPTETFSIPFTAFQTATDVYLFTGREERTPVSLEDVTVPTITFDKVGSIDQIDNRLVFANITNEYRDWAVLQRSTSEIKTSWNTTIANKFEIDLTLADELEDASTGIYSFQRRTFQRDEVYAFGVVYVFNDGSESPVFHIPGRPVNVGYNRVFGDFNNSDLLTSGNNNVHMRNQVPLANSWDDSALTVVADGALVSFATEIEEKNVVHIPLTEFVGNPPSYVGSTILRWKVYNTAVAYDASGDANTNRESTTGVMAYNEMDLNYPDIVDCDGVSIWGSDAYGNVLEGTPVRHHRFPDTTLIKHELGKVKGTSNQDSDIINMHIQFDNINIPAQFAGDIQGYYIVMANRDDSTSTVLDTGMLGGTSHFTNDYGVTGLHNTPNGHLTDMVTKGANNENEIDEVCILTTPRSTFLKNLQPTEYIKIEDISVAETNTISTFKDFRDYLASGDIPGNLYRQVQSYAYVNRRSLQGLIGSFPNPLFNVLMDLDVLFVHLNSPKADLVSDGIAEGFSGGGTGTDDLGNPIEHMYVGVKQWIKPYSDLTNLQYQRTHQGLYETDTVVTGDCYIGEMTFKTTDKTSSGVASVPVYFFNSDPSVNRFVSESRLFQNYYFSTKLNTELRQRGEEFYDNHWRAFSGDQIDFVNLGTPDGVFAPNNLNLNYLTLNRDMDIANDQRLYFPLPISYDFCSECTEDFPTRIWYSQRAYQEEYFDNYKVFLANDYRDLLSNGGEITNLFVFKDQLYAQTPETTWFVSTRPQQLQTNEGNISVGTGDLLAIPPKRLETVDRGYAGNQDKFSTTVSEFGTTWIDANAGKVFNFVGQLQELSAFGQRNWFAENLSLSGGINDQLSEFDIDSTVHKNGIGFIGTFDPRHNRYILHKKYYKVVSQFWLDNLIATDGYVEGTDPGFNTQNGEFYTYPVGFSPDDVDLHSNANSIVEDLSWTISYSYPHKSWVSYHSYKPNWLWHDRNNLFSFVNNTYNDVDRYGWKHHSRKFGEFYNRVHPSSLYLVFNKNPTQAKTFNSVDLIASSYEWNGDSLIRLEDDTLDQVMLHTGRQSSGLLDVAVKSDTDLTDPFISIDYSLDTIEMQNNEDAWNLNKFYDLTSDYNLPIFTSDWNNIEYRNRRFTDGYIYYPNDARHDFNKHYYDINTMRGHWVGCFITYDNTSQNKIVIDFLSTSQNISFK